MAPVRTSIALAVSLLLVDSKPTNIGCDFKVAGCDESIVGDGASYIGCRRQTVSGRTCQAWNSQTPHTHDRTPSNYPNSNLESNYCRNPDGEPSIWCYTTDPNSRFELCLPLARGNSGRNVMTTTGNIMGAPPVDSTDLASASTDQFNDNSTVTITFISTFVMGFAHATAGTFTAPQFTGTPARGASICQGSQAIVYKDTVGPTNTIVWNAPNDVSALTNVTLSFAGAASSGSISRHSLILTKLTTTSTTTSTSTTDAVISPPTSSPSVDVTTALPTLLSTSFSAPQYDVPSTSPKTWSMEQNARLASGTSSLELLIPLLLIVTIMSWC